MAQSKRQEQKEMTRQRIMDSSARLFANKGFATPTSVIAQEAGVSHGAIFVHFPTREILQLHVLERFSQEVGTKLHNLTKPRGDISELLHAHISVLEEYESFYKKLISEIISLPDEARTILVSLQSTMSLHFGVALEKARLNGSVKDIPLHMLFNTWIGLLHYYLQNSDLFTPGKSVLKHRRDELVNCFIDLISK